MEACQREAERLQKLVRYNTEVLCDEAPTLAGEQQYKGSSLANMTKTGQAGETRSNDSRDFHSHDQSVGQSHDSCSSYEGRHIHRLEGKCGHPAVLKGGTPHIDFVAGDKIECFEDVQVNSDSVVNGQALCPSQYRRESLGCRSAGQRANTRLEEPEAHTDISQDKVECFGGVQASSDSVANGQALWPSQCRCESLGCPNADQCSRTRLEEPEEHNTMSQDKVECFGGVQAKSDSVANGQALWPSQCRCENLGCRNADQCSKTCLEEPEAHDNIMSRPLYPYNFDLNDDDDSWITHLFPDSVT